MSKRRGLHEVLCWKCGNCNEETDPFNTFPFLNNDKKDASEINVHLIQGGIESRSGLTGLFKSMLFIRYPCTSYNKCLPVNNEEAHNIIPGRSSNISFKAATTLKEIMQMINPEVINHESATPNIPVSVSVDGMWQKCYGYSSLLGVVFILSVETGEVRGGSRQSQHPHWRRSDFLIAR